MPKKNPIEDFLPLWFRFTPAWYGRLQSLAQEAGVDMDEVIREGVKLYAMVLRETAETTEMTSENPSLASDLATQLAKLRWEKTSPEKRREQARYAAMKRWGRRRKKET